MWHFLHCKWEPVAVQPMNLVSRDIYDWSELDTEHPEPVTEVLERCTVCGDIKTRTLSGRWTLAQVKGEK